jgi:hypothetical protein
MAFDTFDSRLKVIAQKALGYFKSKYGNHGLKTETEIAPEIGWAPTFHLRPSNFRIVAVEVADNLYPQALKLNAHDILNYQGSPISVYQVCSLQAYQSDPKQTKVNMLRQHGFGIITVDDDGNVRPQHKCIPLAQHISEEQLKSELSGLNKALRANFEDAHSTYLTNEGQGLQQAGQIVEAMISCIAAKAAKKKVITPAQAKGKLANVIDSLYATNGFKSHRAALGGARDFVKDFRNIASHPPKNAKEAAQKIKKCRTGFLDGVGIAKKLYAIGRLKGYKIQVHVT